MNLASLLKKLPHTPGVYKFKDAESRLLYVGKAKDLSNRVHSYFRKEKNRPVRTQKLIEKIADVEWIEVGSDLEALMLETNLIKEFRPKYNVLMKDDKNFVYIKITKEDFPRILIVRKVERDGAKYFGPKTAAHKVKKTLMLLQKLFLYRSCDLGLKWMDEKVNVTKKTVAYPCLDYHIKRCAAPCIDKINPEEYQKSIDKISNFLEGKTGEIEAALKMQMQEFAMKKEFEKAALLRDKLNSLQDIFEHQLVTAPDFADQDILGFVLEGGKAYLNLFLLREGKLINQENFVSDSGGFEAGDEEFAQEVVESFLYDYYDKCSSVPSQILLPIELDSEPREFFEEWLSNQKGKKVTLLVPERGKKHQLIELAQKNARSFQKQYKLRWELTTQDEKLALKELASALELPKEPKRMECYDISHLGGSDTVASMVVFENGMPKKSDYRKFHLRTIKDGEIDDFKSMNEILSRRLRHLAPAPKGITFRKGAKTQLKSLEILWKKWMGKEPLPAEPKDFFLALKGKHVVGLIRLEQGKDKHFLQRNIYVAEALRKKGIAKALMRYAYEKSKAKRVYLQCTKLMETFYEEFGFESIKVFPEEFQSEPGLLPLAYDPLKHYDASFNSKPDLIVIDGGKGQLSSALKSRNDLSVKIPMIGLAKREEDVFIEGSSLPLLIPKDSQAIYLLRRIRDEAHRFAITFQREARRKGAHAFDKPSVSKLNYKT